MEKTLKQIVYSVWEQVENFNITDDSVYSELFLEDLAVNIRTVLVQEAYKNKDIDETFYQIHEKVAVETLDNSVTVAGILFEGERKYCKAELPSLMAKIGILNISYFGNPSLTKNYSRKSLQELLIREKGVLHKINTVVYAMINATTAIMKQTDGLGKTITCIGIFADPRLVNTFDKETSIFPVPNAYKVELLMLQQILSTKNIPFDIQQDGQRTLAMAKPQKQQQPENG